MKPFGACHPKDGLIKKHPVWPRKRFYTEDYFVMKLSDGAFVGDRSAQVTPQQRSAQHGPGLVTTDGSLKAFCPSCGEASDYSESLASVTVLGLEERSALLEHLKTAGCKLHVPESPDCPVLSLPHR